MTGRTSRINGAEDSLCLSPTRATESASLEILVSQLAYNNPHFLLLALSRCLSQSILTAARERSRQEPGRHWVVTSTIIVLTCFWGPHQSKPKTRFGCREFIWEPPQETPAGEGVVSQEKEGSSDGIPPSESSVDTCLRITLYWGGSWGIYPPIPTPH